MIMTSYQKSKMLMTEKQNANEAGRPTQNYSTLEVSRRRAI